MTHTPRTHKNKYKGHKVISIQSKVNEGDANQENNLEIIFLTLNTHLFKGRNAATFVEDFLNYLTESLHNIRFSRMKFSMGGGNREEKVRIIQRPRGTKVRMLCPK